MNKRMLKRFAFIAMASAFLMGGQTLLPIANNTVIAEAASYEIQTVSWDGNTPYFTRIYKNKNWPKSFNYTADNDEGWTCYGNAKVDSWAKRTSGWYKGYYTVVYKGTTTHIVD